MCVHPLTFFRHRQTQTQRYRQTKTQTQRDGHRQINRHTDRQTCAHTTHNCARTAAHHPHAAPHDVGSCIRRRYFRLRGVIVAPLGATIRFLRSLEREGHHRWILQIREQDLSEAANSLALARSCLPSLAPHPAPLPPTPQERTRSLQSTEFCTHATLHRRLSQDALYQTLVNDTAHMLGVTCSSKEAAKVQRELGRRRSHMRKAQGQGIEPAFNEARW